MIGDCRDINECTERSSTGAVLHTCTAQQTCVNTVGSFQCTTSKFLASFEYRKEFFNMFNYLAC